MSYLVVLEVSQKQQFIFKANKLKQNIGASIIIRTITENLWKDTGCCAESNVLSVGGGKGLYKFEHEAEAKKFISVISEMVLVRYPGVELFGAIETYDNEKESVIAKIESLYEKLEKKKSQRYTSFRVNGFGVERLSTDSQMPVALEGYIPKENKFITNEAYIKESRVNHKDDYSGLLPKKNGEDVGCSFAQEFDNIGVTKDSKSYIAVIVLDGNKMGAHFKKFRESYEKQYGPSCNYAEINDSYLKAMKKLSKKIDDGFLEGVKETNQYIYDMLDRLVEKEIISQPKDNQLPIRPLIVAGDDICVVTDARIAVPYALKLIEACNRNIKYDEYGKKGKDKGKFRLKTSAGIAMVNSHYPFFLAHELAEELCHNAKSVVSKDEDVSVFDFHIVEGEIEGSINDIRRLKYDRSRMTAKPYAIDKVAGITSFKDFQKKFKQYKEAGVGRSVIKEYRNALSAGDDAMKKFWSTKRLDKKFPTAKPERSLDFDVIEMLDIYHDLEEEV